MIISNSKYVELESIPLCDLFKLAPGSVGFYVPTKNSKGCLRESIAKLSAQAKAYAIKAGKKCVVKTLLTLETDEDADLPTASKLVKITVTDKDEFTAAGMRYMSANNGKN